MENISDSVISDIYDHAHEAFPNECCGYVLDTLNGPKVVRVENVHDNPRKGFRMRVNAIFPYLERSIFMYHSHPNGSTRLSTSDADFMHASSINMLVVNWPKGEIRLHGKTGDGVSLVGRHFIYGVQDCYALVRDYYRTLLGVTLPDYERPRYGWWERGDCNPFIEDLPKIGFYWLDEGEAMQEHDVIVMRMPGSQVPNHLAVLVDGVHILHHRLNSTSTIIRCGRTYREATVMVARYDG